uniref:Protein PsbN n=1 Tax=Agarophyton chilense TaxID=2510777 RepID=A0A141SEW6_AGACH|nr:photosystem II protein N [Agarophyton chilense]AMK96834.1 photosystem II protein N [Agarophyton chilense]ASP44728.1 photosystem II reaction center protein N [Agarophyton chilense]UAD84440.1 photosystem II protein N [Agarophyton chilense]
MQIATVLSIFISSLLLGITIYSIYISFGPISRELRDPFEEHEE